LPHGGLTDEQVSPLIESDNRRNGKIAFRAWYYLRMTVLNNSGSAVGRSEVYADYLFYGLILRSRRSASSGAFPRA